MDKRRKDNDRIKDQASSKQEPYDSGDALPSSDAKPTHREDFNRLLVAAARKPAPKD
jgi:hypothetical protein